MTDPTYLSAEVARLRARNRFLEGEAGKLKCLACGDWLTFDVIAGKQRWSCEDCGAVFGIVQWNTINVGGSAGSQGRAG